MMFNPIQGALHAAFGANYLGMAPPGPISHLTTRLLGEFNAGGMPQLGMQFPQPTLLSPFDYMDYTQAMTRSPYGMFGTPSIMPPLLQGNFGFFG